MLVTVEDVIASMGMDLSLEEALTPIISSAIEKATALVEAQLGTGLLPGSAVETFFPDSDLFVGVIPQGLLSLKLRHMFVSPTVGVSTVAEIGGIATPVDPLKLRVDPEQGIVRVPRDYDGTLITVTYTYGFPSSSGVPLPIRQAILSVAPMIFRASQISTDAGKAGGGSESSNLSTGMLNRYCKNTGFMYKGMDYVGG